ncbi:MAG: protein kinase [Opitutaceae bacterium]|nr:protein kinase [Opitutaceae bacterium]
MKDAAKSAPRCATCGGPLASAGWCGRCVLGEIATESAARAPAAGGLFSVPGHVVLAELGRGAAGIVYRARQENPAREVALKILRPHEAGSAESRARFRMEATTVAGLDHPAILPVLSVGEHDGLPYFTMKLCAGGSLASRLENYRGQWRESATLVATLADAVHHAHERGVLHRDLKPGNILFDEAGRPFVSDFGIAKHAGEREAGAPVTQPHAVMGTRGYLASEVLRAGAGAATVAADVFGLGAILHELITGAPPAEMTAGAATSLPALKTAPRDLAVIAGKALAPEPAGRYATAAALADDLRAWLAGRPIAARPISAVGQAWAWARRNPALAGASAAALLALVAVAVVATGAAVRLRHEQRATAAAFAQSQASLADALVAQARAVRQSGREGQRREALKLLARAAAIKPDATARDEAVAALALTDWEPVVEQRAWPGETRFVVPSADFKRVLTEDTRRVFTLRDADTGAARWEWRGPARAESRPVYSADGRWVAVRLADDTVNVLATADGRRVLRLRGRPYAFKGDTRGVGQDMDFSPDGKRVAVTRPEGGVTFHRLPRGVPAGEWAAPEWVTVIAFSPDGTRLAVGGGKRPQDYLLAVIDAATGRMLLQEKSERRVDLLAWSEDGLWLATRQHNSLVEVRAASDLRVRAVVPDREATHAKILPDAWRILLTEAAGETRLWDIDLGRVLLTKADRGRPGAWYAGEPPVQWRSHAAGPVLLSALSESPVLRGVEVVAGGMSVQQRGGPVAVSADGRWLQIGTRRGGVLVDVTGKRMSIGVWPGQIPEPGTFPEAGTLRLDPKGDAVWVALQQGGLWRHPLPADAAGAWAPREPGEQIDAEPGFFCADLHATTGRLALVRPTDGAVKIVDVSKRAVVARWTHAGAVSAAFAPDGARLAVTGARPSGAPAAVHDTLTGRVEKTLGEVPGGHIAWSRDGRWIYAGSDGEERALWSTADWTRGPDLGATGDDRSIPGALSPNGRWLAFFTVNRQVRLVETATGRTLVDLAAPDSIARVPGLIFAGDDRLCVVSGVGRVHIWDLAALRRELCAVGLDWAER